MCKSSFFLYGFLCTSSSYRTYEVDIMEARPYINYTQVCSTYPTRTPLNVIMSTTTTAKYVLKVLPM